MERLTLLLTLASACFGQAEPRPKKRNSPDGSEAGASRVGAPSEHPPLVSHEWTLCPREATDCPRAADGCAPCPLSRTMSEVHDSSLLLLPPPNRDLGLVSVCTASPAFHGLLDEDSAHGARSGFSSFRFAPQNACRQPTYNCAASKFASRPSSRGPRVHVLPCCDCGTNVRTQRATSRWALRRRQISQAWRQLHCRPTRLGFNRLGPALSARLRGGLSVRLRHAGADMGPRTPPRRCCSALTWRPAFWSLSRHAETARVLRFCRSALRTHKKLCLWKLWQLS
ncbi:hypothetical protein PAL_GLEAN10001636 [Pteropus alecto]|uniref:Secreted protein n=1 Tax=Pteropus alecto TaxID=9402 RepID=L5K780_PTEAL|nr:hypothetical protein PAL_GLEAN10001636 [Pteropus alecto]